MTGMHNRLVWGVKFLGYSMDNMPVLLAMAIVAALIHEPLQHSVGLMVLLPLVLAVVAEMVKWHFDQGRYSA